jgi:hypothetical protein
VLHNKLISLFLYLRRLLAICFNIARKALPVSGEAFCWPLTKQPVASHRYDHVRHPEQEAQVLGLHAELIGGPSNSVFACGDGAHFEGTAPGPSFSIVEPRARRVQRWVKEQRLK